MKKYVQYGCGLTTPEQWENYDASPSLKVQRTPVIGGLLSKYIQTKGFGAFPDNVIFGDIIKGLPVADDSCDAVYCSHTLEHLSLEDFRVALKNTHKILKKDGVFRCVVPDLAWAIRKYIVALDSGNPQGNLAFLGEDTLLGQPHRPKSFLQKLSSLYGGHHHLWMWDSAAMKEELRKAGFREIRDCQFNDAADEMFKYVETTGKICKCRGDRMQKMMKILLSDLHISLIGHNLGHVQNAINYLAAHPDGHTYLFLVNPLPEGTINLPKTDNIKLVFLSEEQYKTCQSQRNYFRQAQVEWKIIEQVAAKYQVGRVVLMELDMYQLAIGSSKASFKVSGIWMRPFSRISTNNNSFKEKIKTFVWKIQKNVTMWWCCHNANADNIFIFNDYETVKEMNRQFGQHFRYLPDPIYPYPVKENFNIRQLYSLNNGEVIYLIFGSIDSRKNVVNILKAFQKLTPEEAAKSCLMLIGKTVPSYQNEVEEAIAETRKIHPTLKLIVENRFVDDDEMEAFFAQSDVIMRMNVNYYASSGIIGIAAKHNKPSIVSDYGLVAELTEQYKLGVLENPDNTDGIANALRIYLNNPAARYIDGQNFYKKHDPATFVKTLISTS